MKTKKTKQHRAPNGSVSVEIRGQSLGLRLPERHFGSQRYFALFLPNNLECRAIAELKAKELELELALGKFDGNLEKFRPPVAPQLASLPLPPEPNRPLQLLELWERYAKFRQSQVSPTTWRNTYLVIASHCQNCPVQDLERAIDISDWAIATLTTDTVERFLMQVNAACKWALRRKKIEANPFADYRQELKNWDKKNSNRQPPKVFWKDEQQAIIQAFENQKPELASLIKFYFLTGCRTGEALALRWSNVQPDWSSLTFEKNLIIAKGGEIERDQGKTGHRNFPCNNQLRSLLVDLWGNGRRQEDRIFPFSHQILRNAWAGKKRDGIVYRLANATDPNAKKIREYLPQYHTRHTFITACLTQGIAIQELAFWVGNSPEIILKRYAGVIRNIEVPEF